MHHFITIELLLDKFCYLKKRTRFQFQRFFKNQIKSKSIFYLYIYMYMYIVFVTLANNNFHIEFCF